MYLGLQVKAKHSLTHVLVPNLNKHFWSTSYENIWKKGVPADALYWSVMCCISPQCFRGELGCAEIDFALFCSNYKFVIRAWLHCKSPPSLKLSCQYDIINKTSPSVKNWDKFSSPIFWRFLVKLSLKTSLKMRNVLTIVQLVTRPSPDTE